MSKFSISQHLLPELENLYKKIVVHIHKHHIEKTASQHFTNPPNLKDLLSDHLENIAEAQKEINNQQYEPITTVTQALKNQNHAEATSKPSLIHKYFEHQSLPAIKHELHSSLAEQLKRSAIDHIHHASRYAHLKDKHNVNLHLEIAGNAMKESAHYMDRTDFDFFRKKVCGLVENINA